MTIDNIYSLDAKKSSYIHDIKFYSLYSSYKIFDKLQYTIKQSPGHKPVKKVVFGDDNEENSDEFHWCEYGYNKDGSCWHPEPGLV